MFRMTFLTLVILAVRPWLGGSIHWEIMNFFAILYADIMYFSSPTCLKLMTTPPHKSSFYLVLALLLPVGSRKIGYKNVFEFS